MLPKEYVQKPYMMRSGHAEQQKFVYRKVESKSRKEGGSGRRVTWYVAVNVPNPADHLYADCHDPDSQGFGGAILEFPLEDGTVDKVKGPWHGNACSMYADTGEDLRDKYWSFLVVARKREDRKVPGHYGRQTVFVDVLYMDPPEGKIGLYNREKDIFDLLPDEENVAYLIEHDGGSSSGYHDKAKEMEIRARGEERW